MPLPACNKGFLELRVYPQSQISFCLSICSVRHIQTAEKPTFQNHGKWGTFTSTQDRMVRLPVERTGEPIHIHYVLLNLTLRDPFTFEHTICPIHILHKPGCYANWQNSNACNLLPHSYMSSKTRDNLTDARADNWTSVWVLCVITSQHFWG